jgi:hypothetical protein
VLLALAIEARAIDWEYVEASAPASSACDRA